MQPENLGALWLELEVQTVGQGPGSRFRSAVGREPWETKASARQNAIHPLSAVLGALILARAVDDPELSDEILASVRKSLASM